MITLSFLDENQNYKVQYTQHGTIYRKHINISRISTIEVYLYEDAAAEFVWIKAWKMKTDVQWCLGGGMEAKLQLNTAWFRWNFQLLYECAMLQQLRFSMNYPRFASTDLPLCLQMMIRSRNKQKKWRKIKNKVERIWENLSLDMKLWRVDPEFCYN